MRRQRSGEIGWFMVKGSWFMKTLTVVSSPHPGHNLVHGSWLAVSGSLFWERKLRVDSLKLRDSLKSK